MPKKTILCSACLMGVSCRYDGKAKTNEKALKLLEDHHVVLVCPEQLGGLPTPRPPAEITNNMVVNKNGEDVTLQFSRGADEVLNIAKLVGAKDAVLKSNSPSCGSLHLYDGTFTGTLTEGDGVTASLLKKNGIRVVSENDL